MREHLDGVRLDVGGGERRGDPARLVAGDREHLRRRQLTVHDRDQVGESAADVDSD
jgi:hypothetical protein